MGTDPDFAHVYWDAYKYYSKPVLVPQELLEDAIVDIPAILGEMLGERLGRIQNDDFTFATGNDQPMGILTKASLGVRSAKADQINADEFVFHDLSIVAELKLRRTRTGTGSKGQVLRRTHEVWGQRLK